MQVWFQSRSSSTYLPIARTDLKNNNNSNNYIPNAHTPQPHLWIYYLKIVYLNCFSH
jgi:hypothetical protein